MVVVAASISLAFPLHLFGLHLFDLRLFGRHLSFPLDEILFGKKDSKDRLEIVSFIELAQRTEADELVAHL